MRNFVIHLSICLNLSMARILERFLNKNSFISSFFHFDEYDHHKLIHDNTNPFVFDHLLYSHKFVLIFHYFFNTTLI